MSKLKQMEEKIEKNRIKSYELYAELNKEFYELRLMLDISLKYLNEQ